MTSLLRAASFGAQRPAPAQWSLFLPVDAAFDRLGGRQLDALIHDPETRRALIDRHLLAEPVSLADLKQGEPVTTLGGQALAVSVGDKPRLNGATVLAERTIGDGRVFIVDHLL
jgi:uncharacterized surface protein with fasciclin (FAS1) repeats